MKRFAIILVTIGIVCLLVITGCAGPSSPAATTSQPATSAPKPTSSQPTSVQPTASQPTANQPTQQAPTQASTQATKLKFAYTMPKGVSIAAGYEWFGPEFEKRTNGRYKVEIYPGSTLVASNPMWDAIKTGVVQLGQTAVSTFPKYQPLSLIAQTPTLGIVNKDAKCVTESSAAFWDLYNQMPEVQAEYKDFKLVHTIIPSNFYLFTKKKEVHMPADLKGLRVGGSGSRMEMLPSLGAAKVIQSPQDAYMNLDKGVVDAVFVSISNVDQYQLQEVIGYGYFQDYGTTVMQVMMNKEAWNAMSQEDQKIMLETWRDIDQVAIKKMLEDAQRGMDKMQAANRKVVFPTAEEAAAWEKAAGACVTSWQNDAKAVGMTQETLDKVYSTWITIRNKHLANLK